MTQSKTTRVTFAIAGLVAGGLVTTLVIGQIQPQSREDKPVWASGFVVTPQLSTARIWSSIRLTRTARIPVGSASLVADDRTGGLYVFDSLNQVLERIGPNARRIGQIPNENSSINPPLNKPTDVTVAPDGTVVIAEPASNRIRIIDSHLTKMTTLRVSPSLLKVAFCGGVLGSIPTFGFDHMFELREWPSVELADTGGHLIANQRGIGIVLDGTLVSGGSDDSCIYVSRYADLIVGFDGKAMVKFAVRAVEPQDMPRVLTTPEGVTRVLQEDAKRLARSATVHGSRLYVVSTRPDGSDPIADIYDESSGRYTSSVPLPKGTKQMVVSDAYWYTVDQSGAARWLVSGDKVITR